MTASRIRLAPRVLVPGLGAALFAMAACGAPPEGAADTGANAATARDVREITMTEEQIQRGGVRWEPAVASVVRDTVEVPGQLTPNEDRTTRVSAPARARVVTLHVRIGDRVTPNQPLVTLQGEQAVAARAEYAKAVADLAAHETAAKYARAVLERAERLLALKAMSRQDVERARVESEAAEAARLQIAAEVDRAKTTLGELGVVGDTAAMVLSAPFAGVVLSRDVVPGSVVEAGTPLVTVTEPATLWLEISATERVASTLRAGNQVRFIVSDLVPETFTATIENVGAALDPVTRTLPARAVVKNPSGRLRASMFATVTVSVGEPRQGVGVAEGALQLIDAQPVVFVARPDGRGARFERRDVEVGPKTGGQVQLLRAVSPGEAVVTGGAFAVKAEFIRARTRSGE